MYGDEEVKVTNAYKYLEMTFTTNCVLTFCLKMYVEKKVKGM